jgi:hypothetical protein
LKRALAAAGAAVALAFPAAAGAQDLGLETLIEARDQYFAGNCAAAQPTFRAFIARLDVNNPREAALVTTARKYHAACLYAQRSEAEARDVLAQMLRDDPDARVDQPFDPGFVLFFAQILHDLQAELEQVRTDRVLSRRDAEARRVAREQLLRALATTESRVDEVPRSLMWVPFGVGQFANGQTALGVIFLSTELLLTAACLGTFIAHQAVYPYETGGVYHANFAERERAYIFEVANWTAASALLGTIAAGVIQAHVAYQPVRRVTPVPRPLPPELERFRLAAGPLGEGGAAATLRLTF